MMMMMMMMGVVSWKVKGKEKGDGRGDGRCDDVGGYVAQVQACLLVLCAWARDDLAEYGGHGWAEEDGNAIGRS
jgi:hypothetical protein